MAPGADDPGWANGQVWMAHAAATSATDHRFAETFARGGVGQAGVAPAPFRAVIDDWSMTATGAPGDALAGLRLRAGGDGFAYDLTLNADRPPVPQGEDGFSVKSEAGQASYYYSQPFYTLTGTLTLDGREVAVTGEGWLDREWSSAPLTADQEGWDWFALHLDGGAKLMVYRLRHRDAPAFLAGTSRRARRHPDPARPRRDRRRAARLGRGRRPDHPGPLARRGPALRRRGGHRAPERAKLDGDDLCLLGGADPLRRQPRGRRLPRADGVLRCRARSTRA